MVEDLVDVPQAGLDQACARIVCVDDQFETGNGDRISVDVDDSSPRLLGLGEFVYMTNATQARAQVEVLLNSGGEYVQHRATHEGTALADEHVVARRQGHDRGGHRTVGGEIVSAAEQVVIDPGQ